MKQTTCNTAEIELSRMELFATNGGGDPDDLDYNIVHFGMRSNPIFWMLKYNEAIISKLFGNS